MTSLGRGLTDFDDCTRGEAVIDLVRFGTSLLLAAREKGWAAEERALRRRVPRGLPRRAARRRPADAHAGPGHADPRRVQVGPRSRAAPGARPHRQGSPSARRLRGRGPAASPSSSGSAASCPRRLLRGEAGRRAHHGGGQRARREVPDHLRGRHRRRGGRPRGGGEADPRPRRQPLRAHRRGGLARPRRPEADRLRAVRLRGGRPPRGQVLLDARLDGRLPGGLHRLRHPLAARPARGGLRRRGADGPRAPEAPGRGDRQGSPAGGPRVAGRDRGPGARRHPRAWRHRTEAAWRGVQAAGRGHTEGREHPGGRRAISECDAWLGLLPGGRLRCGLGAPTTAFRTGPRTTKQLRPDPGECGSIPPGLTTPTPSRGRCRPGRRRGP